MKLSKTYEPKQYESDIYALWERSESFSAKGSGQSYSVIMPPPNANASLHAGHALTYVLQDIAVRYHRLRGERTLYIPGADHAGFETQVVYEKELARQGKSRFDFTREQLYKQIWDFVQTNKSGFEQQLRQLGISCDWSHFQFTLDDDVIKTAYQSFKRMWDDGYVYRSERLVNFCTFHGTSFADIEVEFKKEQGNLWYFRYPVTGGSEALVVATTRPETMLGDTAVAVHPDDKRYKGYIGKTITLPITKREVPIIADKFVDQSFGTGVVKLTPAHDQNDYDVAKRHDLPMTTIIDFEGKLKNVPEAYRGLKVLEAREKIVNDLKNQGFLEKVEKIEHNVGHCYKCNTVIEPLLKEQWFVDMKPLAAKAIEALDKQEITFYPKSKRDQLVIYLKNLRDWNISRQIAWGIPIPAFQNVDDPDDWIYDERVDQEIITVDDKSYHRDPDVFDTWFSSSQWPFITLGYPSSPDYKDFYPTSLMETGVDILYQWVGRMICVGLYITGKVPFEIVYLHGMVRSLDGRKMSKSLGNVISLEETIEKFGVDALRLGTIAGRSPGYSSAYSPEKVLAGRNFCNKLWNIARYIEDKAGENYKQEKRLEFKSLADHWIINKLQNVNEAVTDDLDNYRFSEAYERLYHFVWDYFADWYIEASKVQPNIGILAFNLKVVLTLLHPFAPFITETIWQTLNWDNDSLIIASSWPEVPMANTQDAQSFEVIKNIITEVRTLIQNLKLKDTKLHYIAPQFIKDNAKLIEQLTGVKTITEVQLRPGLRLTQANFQSWLDVDNKVLQKYKIELSERQKTQETLVSKLEQRLANVNYVSNAPPEIVEQTKRQLQEAQSLLATIEQEHRRFEPQQTVKPTN